MMTPQNKLPAAVPSGFLGVAEATALSHTVNKREGRKVVVIVNDMTESLSM